MKKLVAIALVGALASGIALAASLSVPFFNDREEQDRAAFIGLKNTIPADIVFTVQYFNNQGTEFTPANNTFLLPGLAGVSYRPFADIAAEEGPGQAVPNMTGTVAEDSSGAGSAVISWSGDPLDIVGRLASVSPTGGDSAYLLPMGRSN